MTDSTLLSNKNVADVLTEVDFSDYRPEGTTEIQNEVGAEETVSGMKKYLFCYSVNRIYIILCLCLWLRIEKVREL